MPPSISQVMLARAQQRHDDSLEDMLDAIDADMVVRSGVYFGERCGKCRADCIPIRGRCPWCGSEMLDMVE